MARKAKLEEGGGEPTRFFCSESQCKAEFDKVKKMVGDQETIMFENHLVLDQAASCLMRYAQSLDDTDYVEKMEKVNLMKTIDKFQKVMDQIRVTITEHPDEEPVYTPP